MGKHFYCDKCEVCTGNTVFRIQLINNAMDDSDEYFMGCSDEENRETRKFEDDGRSGYSVFCKSCAIGAINSCTKS